jgi:glycosyltransferase involved in cell wall biosynthesis
MRFHIVNMPHTQTTYKYSWCAYTQKVVKLCNMLMSLGHEVYLYSGWENEAQCTEHIAVVKPEDHAQWWPGSDFGSVNPPMFHYWRSSDPCWAGMNQQAIRAIRERARLDDVVGVIMGECQHPLASLGLATAEWGVGYIGVLGPEVPKAWESFAWRHHIHGRQGTWDLRPMDRVIPNSFELKHFPAGTGGDHFVYLGRFIRSKGVERAVATCRALGVKLVMAGQGVKSAQPGLIVTDDGMELTGDLEYVGVVNPEQRAKLLGSAKGAFVCTTYLGPFEGVAVEAMLCGTPVLTTDWGVFTETVSQGLSGFRCNTDRQLIQAARQIDRLDRGKVREWAMRYTTDNIRFEYEDWFKSILEARVRSS